MYESNTYSKIREKEKVKYGVGGSFIYTVCYQVNLVMTNGGSFEALRLGYGQVM